MKTNYSADSNNAHRMMDCLIKSLVVVLFLGAATTAFSQCPSNPPGNPATYGNNSWIGYIYSGLDTNNPPQNAFWPSSYKGYLTRNEQFDFDPGTGAVSGATICGSHSDSFSMRFRMQKDFVPGYYTITLGGDDGVRLSTDGGATWAMSDWNYHSYQQNTATLYLSGLTNMVIEAYDQGGFFRVNFSYTACTNFSTAPTAISGTAEICAGSSTTLTATGGTLASGSAYQWGTGTVGNNIIAGQTAASITVAPTANTTYWVRRVDAAPCQLTTAGVSRQVTVSQVSTAPTSISGGAAICQGNSTTLTASGGTLAAGSVYEWGTGAVGSNVIPGQHTASITVAPAATTTYWARRVNANSCGHTAAVTATVAVNVPPGDQVSYGSNSWIGYVYTSIDSANPPTNAFTSTYRGYVTQPEMFDMNLGSGALFGTNICGTHPTNFAIRFKMNKVLAAGYYTFTVGGDDGYRLSLDGGATWIASNWQDHSYTTTTTAQMYLSGNTNFVIEFYERAGETRVTFNYTSCSTAPTGISGVLSTCGGNTTLTATGGTLAAGGTYQWGTGAAGSNIISGQTAASITVAPTATTTYWVRRVDVSPCNTPTAATTATVTVSTPPTAPTAISGTSPICSGAGGTSLYASGGSPGSNGQYQWGTGTAGSNIIGNNASSLYVNPTATTTYWVRRYDPTCNSYTSAATYTVTVNTPSTQPTGITGTTTVCAGGSTTLTATGGTHGTGATYAWGTGYTVGQNVISGQTASSITVSPTAQTVYWVRKIDPAPCNTQTQGPSVVVNVVSASTAPTGITGAPAASVCAGTSHTLTATGGTAASGSVYQWGTGSVIGSNVIAGQTGASITVTPAATTTYWVRRYDGAPCPAYTAGATTTVAITAAAGTPSAFGANQWNVYGYSTADITLATAVYAGYYVQNTLNFDTQSGTNSWNEQASPSSSAGWNGCPVPNDNFTFVYKRTGFPCGTYTISLADWDDQAQVYINGTLVWSCASWNGGGACSGNIPGSFNLNATSNIEIRVREQGGASSLAVNFTKTDTASTAPTAISGGTISCDGAAITLTATGGTTGTNGAFQWGTGAIGSNVIAGETSASISVNPTVTTTYWVRRRDSFCGFTTAGVSKAVTVAAASVAGTLTSESSVICRNSTPGSITLTGNTGNVVKWQYASNAAFTAGVTDIATTAATLTGSAIGAVPSTRYFRAVVQNGQCNIAYTQPVSITVPEAVTYNGTWSAAPTALTPVVIAANLALSTNLNVCACQVTNGATITIQPNATLVVKREIVVEESSHITVENNGSIVQIDDDAVNTGAITVKRNTQPMKNFDFTYWSSPVQDWTLYSLSPDTRFDKYYSFNPTANQWVTHMNGATAMEPGRGYIVRAPANWSVTNATQGVYNASFIGVPNTGVVPVAIAKGTGSYNLIGNPYPSAIDIDLFITDPANENLVNGTIYLWTHNTAVSASIPGNAQYNYTADDYAKYNLTGGVKTASTAITGSVAPTGKVASGQGFFIQANSALANGTYSAAFRNSMRVVNQNGQFFKNGSQNAALPAIDLEKHRAWLTISNAAGAYDEMLLGYIEGATNEMDRVYDGPIFNGGNFVSLYSLLGANKLAIQGRALPFNVEDVIPLGYKSSVAGTFSIALDHFDGLFQNQDVYLVDKTDMSYHNLSDEAYTFTSVTGIFDDRFELRFQDNQLGTGEHLADTNSVHIVKVDKHIEISSGNYNMESVQIFDLTAKKVFEKGDINTTLFNTRDLNMAAQVLIVKVALDNDQTVTKKVVMY